VFIRPIPNLCKKNPEVPILGHKEFF
jgi:hypothetical protein